MKKLSSRSLMLESRVCSGDVANYAKGGIKVLGVGGYEVGK